MRFLIPDRFDGTKDGVRFHHHSGASAIGWLVGHMMFVGCPIPYIQAAYLNQVVLLCLFENAFSKSSLAKFREKGEDIENDHSGSR